MIHDVDERELVKWVSYLTCKQLFTNVRHIEAGKDGKGGKIERRKKK